MDLPIVRLVNEAVYGLRVRCPILGVGSDDQNDYFRKVIGE